MSIFVTSDVGGHTLTLEVNGSTPLTMDIATAFKVVHYLSVTLDQLAADHIAKRQQDRINGEYFSTRF
jgi:hypothetical protein